ncbi:CmcJ/NvfI family oxidoreductase [Hyphomicrobium sp. 2TAF46]|uniref:CmcJ/NvfI family oxidoreductase n=1 Tax=Hyphomicrobium sp. 2TAF46 TaxID=3233019 RepID=UPI003F92FDC6
MSTARHVKAELTYLDQDSGPPIYYSSKPGEPERSEGVHTPVSVEIRDARALERQPSLEREGFCLIAHNTRDVDFESADSIKGDYYPQIAALLKQHLDADEVVVFDHNVRYDAVLPGVRRPARLVHVDYTTRSAVNRAVELMKDDAIMMRIHRRFMQVNVWRPLHYAVATSPLAMADASSVSIDDYVRAAIIYPDRKGEILEVTHDPSHKWFFYPGMAPDEMVLFKGFDSEPSVASCRTPHTAFDDPMTPSDAKPRHSLELRAMAFF